MSAPTVVIIGSGQAGLQLAASLRELSFDGRVVLIGDEPHLPYQRPPLSKGYLLHEIDERKLSLRPLEFLDKNRIECMPGKRAVAIDRVRRHVRFEDGSGVPYGELVLATGSRNRRLSVPGAELPGVYYLRTLAEAAVLRERLANARDVVVIGAGFVGLEFAAVAAKLGLRVTVLDVAERPMNRVISRTMSSIFTREHGRVGIRLLLGTGVARIVGGTSGAVAGVETADGQRLTADLVMVGIGVAPKTELAAACGLEVEDGIVVDEHLRTRDPHVSAMGDVAAHINAHAQGRRLRLESVQNAADQARCIALRLSGRAEPYRALPWFWSHQGSLRLQIAGLSHAGCQEVVRGDAQGSACSIFLFHEGRLLAVESLNRAADHMTARRLLAQGVEVTVAQAADSGFDLRSLLR